jgi:hypothetical protein
MGLIIDNGAVEVTDAGGNQTFSTAKRTPIITHKGRWYFSQWFELYRLNYPNQSTPSGGISTDFEITDTYTLAKMGVDYHAPPQFIMGNLTFDSTLGQQQYSISGSKAHIAWSFLLPNTSEWYNADYYMVAGIGFIFYHNLYLADNGDTMFQFRLVKATHTSFSSGYHLGYLENSHVGKLPLVRTDAPWEVRGYDATGHLDYFVGSFIG